MESELSQYMTRAAKFEFFLISCDPSLARTDGDLRKVTGVQWDVVGQRIETMFPFASFDFEHTPFSIFASEPPQFLVVRDDQRLEWDSDTDAVNSWDRLLSRSFAQLRNNIAHGSKRHPPRPFTHGRTPAFLKAGHALIDFIAAYVFNRSDWEQPLGEW
ncbi:MULTISPECIES: hypothetical protein [unclassified Ensifer]|uniref:hypothetical protein n=1 Tax=unclassified Ensifer TaxID=2633371 RepID=UPI00300F8259